MPPKARRTNCRFQGDRADALVRHWTYGAIGSFAPSFRTGNLAIPTQPVGVAHHRVRAASRPFGYATPPKTERTLFARTHTVPRLVVPGWTSSLVLAQPQKERRVRTIGFTSTNTSRRARKISAPALLILAGALGGCSADSFFDPSITGRWEPTPTVMPILDRISSIEDEPAELVQTSPILPGDLLPEVDQYRLGPGDAIEIRIRDFFVIGVEEGFQKSLDQRGYFELSRLGAIRAQGKTSTELMVMIENLVREKQITDKPVVSINLLSQRKQTYSVMGAVSAPGTYFVPAPDFRLLEAIGSSGAINETLPFVYVVRQVSLSDAARGIVPEPEPVKKRGSRPSTDSRPPSGEPANARPSSPREPLRA